MSRQHSLFEKLQKALANYQPQPASKVPPKRRVDASKDMTERFVEKMLGATGARPDLAVVDWKRLDRDHAVVALAYSPAVGAPSKEEVFAYFERAFPHHRIIPEVETARHHAAAHLYTMVVRRVVPTRPYDDAQTMRRVTASAFLDVELGEVWRVEEREDGQKYLAKVMEEDIDAILAREVQKIKAPVRAATLRDIYAGVVFGRGDKVRFYWENKTLSGEVTKVDEATGEVTIKGDDGRTYTVPKEAIFYVSELGSGTKKELSRELKEYYGKLWGEEMANEIIKRYEE